MKKSGTESGTQSGTPMRLTRAQIKALRAIHAFIQREGISPTYDEIAKIIPTVKSNARRLVDILIEKGALTRTKDSSRNLVVTDKGKKAMRNSWGRL